jgi:hypothetical protein
VYVLKIVVSSFVLLLVAFVLSDLLVAIVLSVLLRFTGSDYPFPLVSSNSSITHLIFHQRKKHMYAV